MNGETITEEFSVGGETITREAEVDPSIPRPGESASRHALRGLKAVVDMHCIDGNPQDGAKVVVAYFLNMDSVDRVAAEDYVKARTGVSKEAIRAQFRAFKEQFAEPQELKAPAKLSLAPEHLTDLGNAKRLVGEHRGSIRYLPAKGSWLVWDDTRWAEDETGETFRLAKQTVAGIYKEAASIKDDDNLREAVGKHALRSESERAIKAMVSLAQTEPGIPVLMKDLDSDPWLFNCANGTLDLRTGQLREHRPQDMITKLSPVEYDADATSELWTSFLWTVAGGDNATEATKGQVFEFIEFLSKAAGSALVGENPDQHFFFVYGPPATGKSTWLEAVGAAMGDYAATGDFEAFIQQRQPRETRSSIVALVGSRFVRSSEVDKGKRLAEGILNAMSGGDRLRVRDLHTKSFEFKPTWKLFLAANHRPKLSDDERSGVWRRILQLPFDVQIPLERQDPNVMQTLKDTAVSGPAILAWLVQGCLAWQREGLHPPKQVLAATKGYRAEMDPLLDFATTCIEPTDQDDDRVTAATLWEAYQKFSGKPTISRIEFGKRMGSRFPTTRGTGGTRYYCRVRLTNEEAW